ncbi:MAG: hypothetical protein IT431_13230 [Phycisphaerales bacterium]|nr:hypothetical protein [Phycisphaerales bacterium]
MAGGFSPPPIAAATGQAALDLHASPTETLLDRWLAAIGSLEPVVPVSGVLCACGGAAPAPREPSGRVRVFPDQSDYRGPAGALRDALDLLPPTPLVLALEAARICRLDLGEVVRAHTAREADVTVVAHADGSPAGVYLLRRDSLDLVPPKGFMDLKEQWLGRVVGEGQRVLVHRIPSGSCPRVRTRLEYLRAVLPWDSCSISAAAEAQHEPRVLGGARVSRSLVCAGAEVRPGAVCVDSVVLPGAVLEPGALVARSVIASEIHVREGMEIVDAVLGPQGIVAGRPQSAAGVRR